MVDPIEIDAWALSAFAESTGVQDLHRALQPAAGHNDFEYISAMQRQVTSLTHPIFDFFDEVFYLMTNKDILTHLRKGGIGSGLEHFLGWGIREGRAPMRERDLVRVSNHLLYGRPLASRTGDAQPLSFDQLCESLPFIPPALIASCFIRERVVLSSDAAPRLGKPIARHFPDRPWLSQVMEEFDEVYYCSIANRNFGSKSDAFLDYIYANSSGTPNPNREFDEEFYRAFHYDIGGAIDRGELLFGFEHYVLAGRKEGRLPRYDAIATLEAVMKNVTAPVALNDLDAIEAKVSPCAFELDATRLPTVWIIVPFLYTDLMFGGFASFVEFIEQLLRKSIRIGLFIKDAPKATLGYFKYRSPNRLLARCLDEIEVYSPIDSGSAFIFGPKDLFMCYSNWDGMWGIHFAAQTELGRPIFWIQEHEAIFFSYDSKRFLMDSVYLSDHIGIFNSEFLRQYFQRQRIGLYKEPEFASRNSLSYEHVLQFVGSSKADVATKSKQRRFLVYARPEGHATRNLFEIAMIALRFAVRRGVFDGSWEFKGIGSLGGPYTVELAPGKDLEIIPKMPLDEYRDFIQGVDIGMSLMYAPHPSLLPYEIALTGAVVVTNNFEERGTDFFRRYDDNIISFDLSVERCVEAITQAVQRVTSPGYSKHRPKFTPRTWTDVFSDDFFLSLKKIGLDFAGHHRKPYSAINRG